MNSAGHFKKLRYPKRKTRYKACHSFWRRHPDLNRGIRVLQTHALPLGYVAVPGGRAFSLPPSAYAHQQPGIQPGARPAAVACKIMRRLWILLYSMHPQAPGCSNNKWSGRRGSNPLPPPWQGGALPDELRPHGARQVNRAWCLRSESNQRHEDFQSSALPTELQRHMGYESYPL